MPVPSAPGSSNPTRRPLAGPNASVSNADGRTAAG